MTYDNQVNQENIYLVVNLIALMFLQQKVLSKTLNFT